MVKLKDILILAKKIREKDKKMKWEDAKIKAKEQLSKPMKEEEVDKKFEEINNKKENDYKRLDYYENIKNVKFIPNDIIVVKTGERISREENVILSIPRDSPFVKYFNEINKVVDLITKIDKDKIEELKDTLIELEKEIR